MPRVAEPTGKYLNSPEPLSFDLIYERVKHIDPMDYEQRDGKWIKEKSQEIRAYLNKYKFVTLITIILVTINIVLLGISRRLLVF